MRYQHIEKKLPAIGRVTPLPDYRLELQFTTGSKLILDMTDRLDTLRYSPLIHGDVFRSVSTDGDTLFFGVQDVPAAMKENFPVPDTVAAVEIPVWEALRLAINFPVWEDWEGGQ